MRRAITATVAAALALTACGGGEEPAAVKQARLPQELATALALESDQIAESLDAGRECAAHRQAQALRAHVGDAVGSGEVPVSLGREMSEAAQSLADGIQCEPVPAPAPQPTGCEQIVAQLAQLETQMEQAEEQEHGSQGTDKKAAKDLRKQLENQAKELEDQLKEQCGGEGQGDGPPGLQDGHPGQGNGNGPGGGGD